MTRPYKLYTHQFLYKYSLQKPLIHHSSTQRSNCDNKERDIESHHSKCLNLEFREMVGCRREYCTVKVLLLILVVSSFCSVNSARPLEDIWWPEEVEGLLLESLPKGPVNPSGPSGCTHNPNNPRGHCPWSSDICIFFLFKFSGGKEQGLKLESSVPI